MPDDNSARLALEWADALVGQLVDAGVTHFFIAPGSRSTPLTLAAARHPDAHTTVHFDERGTAFMALGAARATGAPAAWITTSGTAVANGFPAVVEASIDHVPLVLITADRPPELRDAGANQTIDQVKIFGDYVRWFFDLPVPGDGVSLAFVRSTAAQAAERASFPDAGPVHLNCMFREPLVLHQSPIPAPKLSARAAYRGRSLVSPAPETVERVLEWIGAAQRGMVVVGRMARDGTPAAIADLAAALGWPLVADIQSQLRLGRSDEANRISFMDALLASGRNDLPAPPDLILHFGSGIVSKRIAQWLAAAPDARRIGVRQEASRVDPFHNQDLVVTCDPSTLAAAVTARVGEGRSHAYLDAWRRLDAHAGEVLHATFRHETQLSEPALAHHVARLVPTEHLLIAGSSMPIRDINMFSPSSGADAPVLANRGASGIDGTVATAVGGSIASGAAATVVCGDLALLHDLNSLAAAAQLRRPFVVVVINNDGGGIFSFLPVARHEALFEPYFGTPHGYTFEHAAAMFGIAYAVPSDVTSFEESYRAALDRGGATLIEVRTERKQNLNEHQRLYDQLRN